MSGPFHKTRLLTACLILSIAAHVLALCAGRMLGSYRFGAAVGEPPVVVVSLADVPETAPPQEMPDPQAAQIQERKEAPAIHHDSVQAGERPATAPTSGDALPPGDSAGIQQQEPEPEPERGAHPVAIADETEEVDDASKAAADLPAASAPPVAAAAISTNAKPREIIPAREEKLTYQISMLGVPVGRAELEAKNGERGTIITLRVKSNPAISSVYSVDNVVETQHVDGRFLMTRIRQHEGAFRSDEAFSINLQQKRVSWTDKVNHRSLRTSLPTDDVVDTLSGIYSLRTRPLQVGKTETLHIFDSETYAEVPVEILRREKLRLPNLAEVEALVVRPLQKTGGIFRRTGEILIWMTDDANKVPVKIVTTIAIGRVTAELVSSESSAGGGGGEGAPATSPAGAATGDRLDHLTSQSRNPS